MPDESSRPAPGNPPGQRHNRDAPAWWDALDRRDLPSGRDGGLGTVQRSVDPRLLHAVVVHRPRRRWTAHLRTVLAALVVVTAAIAVAWLGLGGGSPRTIGVAAVLFGVPAVLAAMTATLVVRRGR